ncbi:MAG TPA: aminoacyl-histidine dipeptidase [Vicinamibacterales bacterium]|nr:aminoacyl-histidine dipeptidase [Vicinamibacterales bacterium]
MPDAIEGLTPPLVWKYFAAFSKIPRCSKHEERAAQFVVDTAKKLGLAVKQDRAGNVVVRKPASAGRERVKSLCLQGHLDMVCEKNAGTAHDFSKDPIRLVRKGNMLMADGTTLGADNGIAVATNLAIMEDKGLQHGPLEFLFTIDEETGLTGANHLEPGFLESRTLMNLDSEEEGALYVGCAGGKDTTATWTIETEAAPSGTVPLEIRVSGLRGGHSGLEIDKGRGNALKILNRALIVLGDLGARLSSINGGNKRNAIPREAQALVFVPKAKLQPARKLMAEWNDVVRAELKTVEPDLQLTAADVKGRRAPVMKKKYQKQITSVISALPHGVIKMSAEISWLVETSTNVAVITTAGKKVTLATSQRSSVASEIREIAQTVRTIMEMGGAEVTQGDGYPGWKPNMDSPILKLAVKTYEQLYSKTPATKAVHAGLECGIIGEKYPGMDMVSFGPTLEGVHSPDEKIHIDTVPKFWSFLTAILKNVN